MLLNLTETGASLTQMVESSVREWTHGRIRNLQVEEIQGRVLVSGQAPSYHTKQLALQGALSLLPGDRFCSQITVG